MYVAMAISTSFITHEVYRSELFLSAHAFFLLTRRLQNSRDA
jgi:hypothetical protein